MNFLNSIFKAGTPNSRKINSVIDKISSKLDSSMCREDLKDLSVNDSHFSNEAGDNSSRRNKRKARVPQQLTPTAKVKIEEVLFIYFFFINVLFRLRRRFYL